MEGGEVGEENEKDYGGAAKESEHGEPLCSEQEALYNFLNYMMGAAFMYYPYTMSYAGIGGFMLAYSFLASCSYYTGKCLIRVLEHKDEKTFGDLTREVMGPSWTYVVVVCQYVELFFYVIGYIVMMGDNFAKLIGWDSNALGRLVMVVVTMPTILLKNAQALSFLSFYSLVSLLLIIACFFFGEFTHEPSNPLNPADDIIWFNFATIFMCHSSLIAGFSGHAVLPELRGQMAEPEKFGNVFTKVYGILTVAYLVCAFSGYLTFGGATETQLTFNFTGITALIVNISIIFNAYCRVGLTIFPISLFLEERMVEYKSKSFFWPAVWTFRTIVLFAALGVSLVLGSLDVVMTVIGIFCASFFVYILSAMLFNNSTFYKSSFQRTMNNVLIAFATFLAVGGLYQLFFQ